MSTTDDTRQNTTTVTVSRLWMAIDRIAPLAVLLVGAIAMGLAAACMMQVID